MTRGSRRARALDDLPTDVFMLCNRLVVDLDHLDANNPTLIGLLASLAVAWEVEPAELLKSSLPTRFVKGEQHPAIPTEEVYGSCIHVLRRPDCPRESLQAALRGFYEFAHKHPGRRQAQFRMAALGKVIGEAHAAKSAQKRQQRRAGQGSEGD